MNSNSADSGSKIPMSAQAGACGTILLTGASGRLGKPMLARLVKMGLSVRAVTPDKPPEYPGVEWVQMDFTRETDFRSVLHGVSHVIHLGAELWKTEVMQQVNGVATEALAIAAESAGVKRFLYTSSICVYGSTKKSRVTEETELIPAQDAARRHYMEKDFLIEYARSKLMGEIAIRKHASKCRYIILRPTEIACERDILKPVEWSLWKRIWRGNRHVHQVYYKDVVNAIAFFLLRPATSETPSIETYNLSNDDAPGTRFMDFLSQGWKELGDVRFRTPVAAPLWMEYIKEHVKWKVWEHRYPLGLTYIDPSRLYSTGYRHEYGLGEARRAALKLWSESNSGA